MNIVRIPAVGRRQALLFVLLLAGWPLTATAGTPPDELAAQFLQPPDSAKPHTWWHWMNGNVTKAGITADLEAMARVGIGGAQIFNVNLGIPPGPVKFMSPEWGEMIRHAAQEAERLGLELCIQNCAGWSTSGGPWITPARAMQCLTTSEVHVRGPLAFSGILPRPPTKVDFYQDIAVFAFRTPTGEEVDLKSLDAKVTASAPDVDGRRLLDGDAATAVVLPNPSPGQPRFIQLEFAQPFAARSVVLAFPPKTGECSGTLQISDDGQKFSDLRTFAYPSRATAPLTLTLGNTPVRARFYRAIFNSSAGPLAVSDFLPSARLRIEKFEYKSVGGVNSVAASDVEATVDPSLVVQCNAMVDLTGRLKADGGLDWEVPAGEWTILRVGHTPTGMKNYPAPAEGTGLECDKLSTAALDDHWAGMIKTVLEAAGPHVGKSLNNILIDSYEAENQNWTPGFRDEFLKRRGYDPLPFLPTVTGRVVDNPAVSERFLWDFRRTISDLFAENFFGHFQALCHQAGLIASIEPYGGPFEQLLAGAPADIPMGEFWVGAETLHDSPKLAATVGHIYGRKVIASESFTAAPGKRGRWQEDPYSLKALGDLVYTLGVNRLVFHRFAMQPWTQPSRTPGMTMGMWGEHFDRTNTWWEPGRAWFKYLARCQYLLQQGRFVADAAYFHEEGAPTAMKGGNPEQSTRAIYPGLPAGYDYDGVNPDVLKTATIDNGQLVLASGMRYRLLIMAPANRVMTPELLGLLRGFVAAGLTLVGPRPATSPSLTGYPGCDDVVRQFALELWGDCDGRSVTEHRFGKGNVVWGQPMKQVLAALNLKPDFGFASDQGTQLAYIHRLDGNADIYFVSNQQYHADTLDCSFRVSGKVPELWDAETGRMVDAPVWREEGGVTRVQLRLGSAGSVFVVFRRPATGAHIESVRYAAIARDRISSAPPTGTARTEMVGADHTAPFYDLSVKPAGQVIFNAWKPGEIEAVTNMGKVLRATVGDVPEPITVTGPWELNFPPNRGAPPRVSLPALISWAEHAESGVRYFSGTATYEKEIEIPASMFGRGNSLWLDLGEVKNLAEVFLNGKPLGILWKPPFRVEITDAVQVGKNKLTLQVTNLWPNRLIGDEQLPADSAWNGQALKEWPQWLLESKPSPTGRLTFTTWRLWRKDEKLLPSGLLGPVTISASVNVPMD